MLSRISGRFVEASRGAVDAAISDVLAEICQFADVERGQELGHRRLDDVAGLRWNQWVSLAAIVGGTLYLVATRGQKWPEPMTPSEVPDDGTDPDVGDADTIDDVDERVDDSAAMIDEPPD